MEIVNAVMMAQRLLTTRLATASLVVDATAGNGKDTLFLAANTPAAAVVWAFDIQSQALASTRDLLAKHKLAAKVRLTLDCHAHITRYINQPVDAAMFNLGYLPGGDHTLSTLPATTIRAIEQTLALLNTEGLITIAAYPGFEQGRLELRELHRYLAAIDQKKFSVACWSMVNQSNLPPILYLIERR